MSGARAEAGASTGATDALQGSQIIAVGRNIDISRRANDFPLFEELEAAWLIAAHAIVEKRYDVLDWFDNSCHCTCPGDAFHTNRTADNHCRDLPRRRARSHL